MLWRKLFDYIELSWSIIWVTGGFELHFLPPEVVEVCLASEETNNGN